MKPTFFENVGFMQSWPYSARGARAGKKRRIRMKQTAKKLFCLVLAAVMVFALGVTAFAATVDNAKHYDTYAFIGDSIAAGHSLPEYVSAAGIGDDILVKDSYAQIVSDAVTADRTICLSMSGLNTAALRYLLQDDYEMDAVTQMLIPMLTNGAYDASTYADMREEYRTAIADTDLLTIGVGSNDLMYTTMISLFKLVGAYPSNYTENQILALLEQQIEKCGSVSKLFEQLVSTLVSLDKAAQMLEEMAKSLMDTYSAFKENWDAIIQEVYALNPDVQIVVVGLYNPMRDMKLTHDGSLSLGHIADPVIAQYNLYTSTLSPYARQYAFARCWDAEVYECFALEDALAFSQDFFATITQCVHPTVAGHRYMAEQILSVLLTEQEMSFFDVPKGAWFYDGVYYAWANGLMNGVTEHLFVPVEIASRAQIATVLYRMAGSPDVSGQTEPFADVADSFWAHDAVVWAYNEGVVNGMGDNLFAPLAPVSRAQFVTMLYRYAGAPDVTGQSAPFIDAADAHWAHDAIVWAYSTGAVNGVTAHTFVPAGAVTRAQIAVILARYQGADA